MAGKIILKKFKTIIEKLNNRGEKYTKTSIEFVENSRKISWKKIAPKIDRKMNRKLFENFLKKKTSKIDLTENL